MGGQHDAAPPAQTAGESIRTRLLRAPRRTLANIRDIIPRVGTPGSRSAALHADPLPAQVAARPGLFDFATEEGEQSRTTIAQLRALFALRWMGTAGALMIGFGGLGAGALPVVGDPYDNFALGALLSQLLQSASALVYVGIGLLSCAWVGLAGFVGTPVAFRSLGKIFFGSYLGEAKHLVSPGLIWRIWAGWVTPLIFTAPLFTQDIYSYLANGSIVRQGLDPYSAGPVQLLGVDNPLARSVPFIWANSPSPYGPVSLGIAEMISGLSGDMIAVAVIMHRLVSILGIIAAGWAISRIAVRCRVSPATALWLSILNPLAILHLVGGIHNEALLLGFGLVGMELALRATSRVGIAGWNWLPTFFLSGVLLSCAGMVKVTGFISLGFAGMALARVLILTRGTRGPVAVAAAAALQTATLVISVAAVSALTHIPLGWISSQGGAATIRSWLSITTDIGVIFGSLGALLGLGDHTTAMLTVTRLAGIIIACLFMLRILLATYNGSIHPLGGLGVSTLVLVAFFPVVHPWYILWAVFPLAAWANRFIFRISVVLYSIPMSFLVLPRGLGLPPGTVAVIYVAAALSFLAVAGTWWVVLRRYGVSTLN